MADQLPPRRRFRVCWVIVGALIVHPMAVVIVLLAILALVLKVCGAL